MSPEDAVELVIEQREGVGRAEDPDQDGTDQALDEKNSIADSRSVSMPSATSPASAAALRVCLDTVSSRR
jgi:hypothetical protein